MKVRPEVIAKFLREAANVADMFDPFSGKKTPRPAPTGGLEKDATNLLNKFAEYLYLKAREFSETPDAAVLKRQEFSSWLETIMDETLDKEEWDDIDMSKLCAMFFLYLASDEEE